MMNQVIFKRVLIGYSLRPKKISKLLNWGHKNEYIPFKIIIADSYFYRYIIMPVAK